MHSRSIVALALVVFLPACAFAQKGRMATSKSPDDPASAPTVRYPTVRDVEDHNPASLLVDKRKKLALADSAVAGLKALEKSIKARSAPTLAMYDSVRRRIITSLSLDATDATPAMQLQGQQNKLGLRNLYAMLREQRGKDAEEALAFVPEGSKKAASDLLKDQGEDFDRMMPADQRGRGSPPGGGN
jgi:hypothetical protein